MAGLDRRIDSVDTVGDTIRCDGGANDSLTRDLRDTDAAGCETVKDVGKLALTPKVLTAEAGAAAKLRMSWSHPESWRKLRTVQLRLRMRRQVVGRVTIRPGRDRVADDGVVRVKRARILTEGKTVTAKLALRLDKSLAGQTLSADVEATDRRGARQVERDAGKVRVS